jgi:hypothetical protein
VYVLVLAIASPILSSRGERLSRLLPSRLFPTPVSPLSPVGSKF